MSAAFDLIEALARARREPPFGLRTVAPEEWALCADLEPMLALREEFRRADPRTARVLSAEHYAACKRAVRDACRELRVRPKNGYDVIRDFEQEIAVRLFREESEPKYLQPWLRRVARNMISDWLDSESLHRELLEDWYGVAERPYFGNIRRDQVVWYMHVKRPPLVAGLNEVEDLTIAAVDDRTERGAGPKRTATCRQDEIACSAIRSKRLTSRNHEARAKIVPEGRVEPSSPLRGRE